MSIRALWVRTAVLVVLLIVVGRTVHVGPFATPRWTDSSGLVASTKHDEGPAIPFQHPGPNHCGLGHVTVIAYEGGDYVQDPPAGFRSLDTGFEPLSYDPAARLPTDAQYTGWHRGLSALWVSPSERVDGRYLNIYIRYPDHIERWPEYPFGCA